jgi:hypothetical protein
VKTGPKPRSLETTIRLLHLRAERKENGCLCYTYGPAVGFGYRYIRADNKEWYVHRLVFYNKHGYLPEVVRHKCDDTTCIEETHLLSGSHADNVADCVAKGRNNIGTRNGRNTSITEDDVRAIRASTETYGVLSARYNISRGGISNIKHRRNWKHVE